MFYDDWEQLSKPTIRPATPSDVRKIARIHVDGWKSTYHDILPDEVLQGLNYADRERTWMRLIAGGDSGPYVLVVDHPSDGVVAFIAAGPERSNNPAYASEVYAVYVDERYQRKGIGRSLLRYVAQIMRENAQQGLLLWSFSDNPNSTFLRNLGAQPVATRSRTFEDTSIEETAFGWPDLKRLLEEGYEDDDSRGAEPEQDAADVEVGETEEG